VNAGTVHGSSQTQGRDNNLLQSAVDGCQEPSKTKDPTIVDVKHTTNASELYPQASAQTPKQNMSDSITIDGGKGGPVLHSQPDPAHIAKSTPACVDNVAAKIDTVNKLKDSGSSAQKPFDFISPDFNLDAFIARQMDLLRASEPQGPTATCRRRNRSSVDAEDDSEDEPMLPQRKKRALERASDASVEVLKSQNFMRRGLRQKH